MKPDKNKKFSDLLGMTITHINKSSDDSELLMTFSNGDKAKLYHEPDYGESVFIESIDGDLSNLIGHPLLQCEEVIEYSEDKDDDSFTWTFYKMATIKGYVTIRWDGTSNGYYSESVDFIYYSKT